MPATGPPNGETFFAGLDGPKGGLDGDLPRLAWGDRRPTGASIGASTRAASVAATGDGLFWRWSFGTGFGAANAAFVTTARSAPLFAVRGARGRLEPESRLGSEGRRGADGPRVADWPTVALLRLGPLKAVSWPSSQA